MLNNFFKFFTVVFLLAMFLFPQNNFAQSITNYTFAATSGTFTPLVGGTTMALSGGTVDDGWYNSIPIGFTYYYMGAPYTTVSTSTNGWLTFDQTLTTSVASNNLTSGTTRPFIAPLWDDLDLQLNTNFSYQTSGTVGNRVFTAEWLNEQWYYLATGNTISFQVKFYEATGAVEFVYRDEGGTVSVASASIGITALTGSGSGTFLSLNGTGVAPTASSSTETTTLATKPASGQTYTFTPPFIVPNAPTLLNFTAITGAGMTLNWTDNANDESGYKVYRSLDGTNYTFTASLPASTVSYTASGLNFGTLYYWRVYAISEGFISTALSGSQATNLGTISGNKNIPGDYATLTAAFLDINTNGLSGNTNLILQSGYTSAGETFPLLTPGPLAVGSYTLTVYPGATGLSITSASATGTIDINGSKNVVFDGRVGGVGSIKDLVIENTNVAGWALRFINDASSNTIKYCVVKGVNTSTSSGVVLFSTTTGTTGNDNNTIDNCDLRDGATTPSILLYGLGTSTTTAHYNSGNIISNNNFYNFYGTSTQAGIYLSSNNTDWTISNNSFYQTTPRAVVATTVYGIYLSNLGNNFTVTGNYIGGSAPNCGLSAWTTTGTTSAFRFQGIFLSVGSTTATSIQNNTIQNFVWTSSSGATTLPGVWCGIYLSSGNANIGNITGNTIGSGSGTGSVSVTTSTTGGVSVGIGSAASSATVNISNNTIGSITVLGSSTGVSHGFNGIWTTSGTTLTINNNTIGSTSTANSINASTVSTSTTAQSINGIINSSSATLTINNNTLANWNDSYNGSSTSAQVKGISTSSGVNIITNNTIRNLSSSIPHTSTGSSSSMFGIYQTATISGGQVVSQNVVHSLSNTAASAAVNIIGIHYGGPTTGTNVVSRNNIHSLTLATTSTTASMTGINTNNGLTNYQNNMIRLGIDASGNSINTGYAISGINDGVGTNNFYFNSIYIGGSAVTGVTSNSYAFNSSITFNTRAFRDNIFVNERSGGTTGKHYAVRVAGSAPNPSGLTINNNIYNVTGTNGVFGLFNLLDVANLAAWQTAVGQDANSFFTDPKFLVPTGTASTVDLHINPSVSTLVEGNGFDIAAVTDDYDGQTRSGLTPVDIGADAGLFTGPDLVAPNMVYTLLGNTSYTTNRQLTVAITDFSGIAASPNGPALYYKKKNDVSFVVNNTPTVVGSNYTFTINSASLGGVAAGDTIQYYVAAMDLIGNSGTSPGGGGGTPPGSTPPATFNSYTIVTTLALPYSQDFNAGTTLPAGWGGTMFVTANHGTAGSNGLNRNLYSSTPTANANTPIVGPIAATTQLEFDYRIVNFSSYPSTATTIGASDVYNVRISTDDGATYTTVYTINQANHVVSTNFATVVVPLGAYAGFNGVIKWELQWGAGDYYFDIDNVLVRVPPVGPPNAAALVSPANGGTGLSINTTLNWASGGGAAETGYRIYFGTDGGGVTPPTNIANNVDLGLVTLYTPASPLAYSTTYYWQIVPYNGSGNATGNIIWSFTTGPNPAISTFPYAEGFEGTSFPPYGYSTYGDKLWLSGSEAHSGLKAARIVYTPAGTGNLQTPSVILPATPNYRIKFWWKDDDIAARPGDGPEVAGL